jgi:hypothetical protein
MVNCIIGFVFGIIVATIGFSGVVKVVTDCTKTVANVADGGLKSTTVFIKKESR